MIRDQIYAAFWQPWRNPQLAYVNQAQWVRRADDRAKNSAMGALGWTVVANGMPCIEHYTERVARKKGL